MGVEGKEEAIMDPENVNKGGGSGAQPHERLHVQWARDVKTRVTHPATL